MGSVYQPKLKSGGTSSRWWIKYYLDGRVVREGARTEDKEAAKRLLKQREGAAASGQPVMPRVDRIRYDEAVADLRRHYETVRGDHVVPRWAREALKPLDVFFAGRRLVAVTPVLVTDYAHRRQAQGAANGTINRELAVLGRMLRLAYEHGKLARLPVIRKLEEAAPREGLLRAGPVRSRPKAAQA